MDNSNKKFSLDVGSYNLEIFKGEEGNPEFCILSKHEKDQLIKMIDFKIKNYTKKGLTDSIDFSITPDNIKYSKDPID